MVSAGVNVVYGWVWRGKPTSDILLQLITFGAQSVKGADAADSRERMTFYPVDVICNLLHRG